jgi:diguanylate cyclase (GGDEF)-like protein
MCLLTSQTQNTNQKKTIEGAIFMNVVVKERVDFTAIDASRVSEQQLLNLEKYKLLEIVRELQERVVSGETCPLTKLPNKIAFERRKRCEYFFGNYFVSYVDVNFLKQTNDTLGHEAGDALLYHVGKQLKGILEDLVRGCDTVYHVSGDEFILFFPCGNQKLAKKTIDRLIEGMSDQKIDYAGYSIPVSAAIGDPVSFLVKDPEKSLKDADESMYARKRAMKEKTKKSLLTFFSKIIKRY